ncbi:hypothetical protein H5T88_07625 [bacterium]|nr:hypothetical protein [bacterium]
MNNFKKILEYIDKRRDLKGEDKVKFRLEVMEFSDKYGVEAAKEAFGVSISTIFKKS